MGRATDPGENHDPGNDQRFTPSLTQEPRLENGLGHQYALRPPGPMCQTASNRDPGSAFNRGAVAAAMTQPWSNGQTEGQITKLKLVKRQMYGRAKLDLLRARLLQST